MESQRRRPSSEGEGVPPEQGGGVFTTVKEGRSWKHGPIRGVQKSTNQRRTGKARGGRQEAEQMTLDERGEGEDGKDEGRKKRGPGRGVCVGVYVCVKEVKAYVNFRVFIIRYIPFSPQT